MLDTIPAWLIFAAGAAVGFLAALAIGSTSDMFWEAVYVLRRWCMILGAGLLAALVLGGAGYLLWQAAAAS